MSKQLPTCQFIMELVHGWRECLASGDQFGHYQTSELDSIAAALRADFLRLPILRFLKLDPVDIYKNNTAFFRWAKSFCSKCQKAGECSLLAAREKEMPSFDDYCAKAAVIRRQLSSLQERRL